MSMISPLDLAGNMSADKNSVIGPFVNLAKSDNNGNIANIANNVMDPFANIGDGAINPLANISAVDPFFVQPDLPNWVCLNTCRPDLDLANSLLGEIFG